MPSTPRAVGRTRPKRGKTILVGDRRTRDTYDEARTVEALLPAFGTDDRDARLAGLDLWGELSHTVHTPAAVEAAMTSFEIADDPEVERAALEVLVRYGDQQEVMRLLEPLALADGPNRRAGGRVQSDQGRGDSARGEDRPERDPQLRSLQRSLQR